MKAQPATATGRRAVHVSNATVRMAREITKEHDKALGKARYLRQPVSPIALARTSWPQEVLMVDGIDRARCEDSGLFPWG
jgi:hypothetical protein